MAAATIEDCFYSVITARKIAETFNMVVVVLRREPRHLAAAVPAAEVRSGVARAADRPERGAEGHAALRLGRDDRACAPLHPRAAERHAHAHRACARPRRATSPTIRRSTRRHAIRSLKLAALQKTLKAPPILGEREGDLLVVGWGSTRGAIEEAVERVRAEGQPCLRCTSSSSSRWRPASSEIMQRFKQVITIEANWCDRPDDALIDETTAATRRSRCCSRALSGRRRLLERSARPADQARTVSGGQLQAKLAATEEGSLNMMTVTECLLRLHDERLELEDYQSGVPRWCTGCGDNAILAAVQRCAATNGCARRRPCSSRASAARAASRTT